jgi:hypothetical protein
MFGPKRDGVTGGWRRLHRVEKDEVGGACSANGIEEGHVSVVGKKARGKETTRKTNTEVGG